MSTAARRFFLCPPDHFQIEYVINEWMDMSNPVHPERAYEQWHQLRETYERLGVEVRLLEPEPGIPELVFPGDSIFLFGEKAIASRFHHPERQPEVAPMSRRFASLGYTLYTLPTGLRFEGNAEAIYWNECLFCGYGVRSDYEALPYLARLLDVPLHAFRLTKPFFHFDTVFCPIDERLAVYYPGAFTPEDADRLRRLFPNLIAAEEAEARRLGCNSVSVNGAVIMSTPHVPRLAAQLRLHGLEVIPLDLSEFYKAGGGAKCLTLEAYRYHVLEARLS